MERLVDLAIWCCLAIYGLGMIGWASLVNLSESKAALLVDANKASIQAIEEIAAKLDRVEKKLQQLETIQAATEATASRNNDN